MRSALYKHGANNVRPATGGAFLGSSKFATPLRRASQRSTGHAGPLGILDHQVSVTRAARGRWRGEQRAVCPRRRAEAPSRPLEAANFELWERFPRPREASWARPLIASDCFNHAHFLHKAGKSPTPKHTQKVLDSQRCVFL